MSRPVRTSRTNFTYKMPGDETGEHDLPCMLTPLGPVSTWQFDESEIALLRSGEGELYVRIDGDVDTIRRHVPWHLRPEGSREKLYHEFFMATPEGPLFTLPLSESSKDELAEQGRIDLFVGAVPTPPVALWIQERAEATEAA